MLITLKQQWLSHQPLLRGFYKSNIQPGMTVAVMGCGSIGLLAIQWARIFALQYHRYRYRCA